MTDVVMPLVFTGERAVTGDKCAGSIVLGLAVNRVSYHLLLVERLRQHGRHWNAIEISGIVSILSRQFLDLLGTSFRYGLLLRAGLIRPADILCGASRPAACRFLAPDLANDG